MFDYASRVPAGTLLAVVFSFAVAGCAVNPKQFTQTELVNLSNADREAIVASSAPPAGPLSLDEAIARALKYNLDRRVKLMEEALAFDQTQVDRFDILPKAVANSAYLSRSNRGASSSTDYVTGKPSLANPSYSQDLHRITRDLTLSWSILDLGVSWYNAHQNANRVLIARERRRKAVLSIIADVRSSYWRAMGAQVLKDRLRTTIREGEVALKDARLTETERLKSPLDSLRFQKTILENLRQLRVVEQELATARAELAALINVLPSVNFSLRGATAASRAMQVPAWNVPVERLEEAALLANPDALDNAYQARIAADETRKAIARMIPGISFDISPKKYDSNSFLVAHTWQEASIRLGGNLVTTLLSAPAQISYSKANEQVVNARRLAVRMALIAQVHVATQQIRSSRDLFINASQLFEVDRKIANTMAVRQANDAQSIAESVANRTVALTSEMRVFTTYAQMQAALGRIQASLGVNFVTDDEVVELDIDALKALIQERRRLLDGGVIADKA